MSSFRSNVVNKASKVEITPTKGAYLFQYLLLANFFQYMEAGAVPALLLQLAAAFDMSSAEQVI